MTSQEIRQKFFDYFHSKQHLVVNSAPMVIKNDPSLMFTNAGMNQFKDIFLGNLDPQNTRVTNSQKCLRVSGKHNDLEEVGHDTYHHTMFEMLGNWSFGDYFKEEAIDFAWEFLTEVLKIDKNSLYATVFKGDLIDKTEKDNESFSLWKKYLPESRILEGSKKDNFWEMGESGPCGPCSEIHVDIRSEAEKAKISGAELVNKDHPHVIEIWNLVFIQYNRLANGNLINLPAKHVDTGMGFERLCMVVQNKQSNYDTDLFQRLILKISDISGIEYGHSEESDVAMRVISDHLRAICFSIADGQLPSNAKAGYVIRRILRRAVRYAYTFLNQQEPLIYKLVDELVNILGINFPELKDQKHIIEKVIFEEEQSFLRTLDKGITLLERIVAELKENNKTEVSGKIAFELYDTYGFPLDLTELILREKKFSLNVTEYEVEMNKQKSRSRQDAEKETSDWIVVREGGQTLFTGYENLEEKIHILRYRKLSLKDKIFYQLVFDKTPFYAESGGQVGDSGFIDDGIKKISILDTLKENNLIIHQSKEIPEDPKAEFHAVVNQSRRINIINNHSATHLMHHALREVLGLHVEQKGSLVNPDYLRFDFSHFQKLSREEIRKVELLVNNEIRKNLKREEWKEVTMEEAKKKGAMALFGEKYGDKVRLIKFGESLELCGGTHVEATGHIGFFKIIKESAIAAGVRRIEAITGEKAQEYIFGISDQIENLSELFPGSKNLSESVKSLNSDFQNLNKEFEAVMNQKKASQAKRIREKITELNGINFIAEIVAVSNANDLRDLSFQIKNDVENLVLILGAQVDTKANISVMISDNLVASKALDASKLIREIAKEIQGGGGGQPFFATAGGKNPEGLNSALEKGKEIISKL
ncbi:MAG: alanine--tRNA ligase [Bacteroidales bacterium]|nr:alanine--tRNA ligase [Bacteroidales bacterium]MCF8391018.1 alanine--tRNA ligase [Bacteroidales bacterium]